jgi:putative spermidine/putrescine transport system permease protein
VTATLQNYIDFFRDPYFVKVFWASLRIAAEVCIADVILAYPVCLFPREEPVSMGTGDFRPVLSASSRQYSGHQLRLDDYFI